MGFAGTIHRAIARKERAMPQQDTVAGFLEGKFLENTVAQWAIAAGIAVATFLAVYTVRGIVLARARALERSARRPLLAFILRLISRISITLVIVLAAVAGSEALEKNGALEDALKVIVIVGLAWQALAWGHVILDALIAEFIKRRPGPDGQPDPALLGGMGLVRFVALVALYAAVILIALDNLINVTPLLAGLGVTGIAVALAVQNILGDLFSSLSIVLDKPFVVGDFIVVGPDHMGTVEKIGLKTTRVRSLSGEQLVFANSDLLGSRIRNFKRMAERRVAFTVGVTYDTTPEQIERVQAIIREAIQARPQIRFDRAHFRTFGPSSLDFEAVYYTLNPEFNVYMDNQQAINLDIMRRFEAEGIQFAYPTQTLHIPQLGRVPKPPARTAPARTGSALADDESDESDDSDEA